MTTARVEGLVANARVIVDELPSRRTSSDRRDLDSETDPHRILVSGLTAEYH
jgi:hypothetical protein